MDKATFQAPDDGAGTPTLRSQAAQHSPYAVPRTDIVESPEAILMRMDMGGVAENDVSVVLEQDLLTVEAHPSVPAAAGYTAVHGEYSLVPYRRQFTLGIPIQRDHIAAAVKDGVLALRLPKAEPAKARKIAVRAG